MNAGIDYGLGQTNIDKTNGIRYGVIPAQELGQEWYDDSEAVYPEVDPEDSDVCENCGLTFKQHRASDDESDVSHNECGDFSLDTSNIELEPSEFIYEKDGYACSQSADDADIFIIKSPYYTYAEFCSPCAPGAGYLLNYSEDGVKTYCFGPDWFWDTETKRPPYKVYRVENDSEVTE